MLREIGIQEHLIVPAHELMGAIGGHKNEARKYAINISILSVQWEYQEKSKYEENGCRVHHQLII